MNKARSLMPALLIAAALASSPAMAGGWGPYFSWSHDMPKTGFPEWVIQEAPVDVQPAMRAANLRYEQDHVSFGVLYDSAPARDKLFSFRMSLGADFAVSGKVTELTVPKTGNRWIDDYVRSAGSYLDSLLDTTGYGGALQFTFGFAPVRTELFRWWVGPCVRVSGAYHAPDVPLYYNRILLGRLKHGGTVAAGGGIETGLNIHVTSFLSVSLAGGFLWNAYGLGAALEDTTGTVSSGTMVWGDGPMFLLQAAALFRTGDDRGSW